MSSAEPATKHGAEPFGQLAVLSTDNKFFLGLYYKPF